MTDWNKYTHQPKGAYAVDTRRFSQAGATFDPSGPVIVIGDAEDLQHNPVEAEFVGQLAARLFVGLSVGQKSAWQVEDVIRITKRVRTWQTGDPSASFMLQKGIWKAGPGEFVDEDSVQIIILETEGIPQIDFEAQMIELGETLAGELKQDAVYVDLQRNGMNYKTLKVVP